MKVQLDKSFQLSASRELAWSLLSDIPSVAQCMPGAEITEQVDDSHYKGKVKFKLGPVATSFKGQIEVKELNSAEHTLCLEGKGGDSKGSSATMLLRASITEGDSGVELMGNAEISITGKLVSFGARVINPVADQILEQFGANFRANLAKIESTQTESGNSEPSQSLNDDGPDPESQALSSSANSAGNAALNPISLIWKALISWVRGLFNAKQ